MMKKISDTLRNDLRACWHKTRKALKRYEISSALNNPRRFSSRIFNPDILTPSAHGDRQTPRTSGIWWIAYCQTLDLYFSSLPTKLTGGGKNYREPDGRYRVSRKSVGDDSTWSQPANHRISFDSCELGIDSHVPTWAPKLPDNTITLWRYGSLNKRALLQLSEWYVDYEDVILAIWKRVRCAVERTSSLVRSCKH